MELLNQAMANLETFWAYRFSRKNRGLNFYSIILWLSKSEIRSSFFLSGRNNMYKKDEVSTKFRGPSQILSNGSLQKIALIGRKKKTPHQLTRWSGEYSPNMVR